MKEKKEGEFRSSVYENRPLYADYDSAEKFLTLQGIIWQRLNEHPNAICSYSGGSDSDILIDLIERTRDMMGKSNPKGIDAIPKVKYVFFNTGLELEATKRHVKEVAEKYGVEIETVRPKKNIVMATREYGLPFVSKIMSAALETVQNKNLPLSIKEEYDAADDKKAKRRELRERYPHAEQGINFLCCCNSQGEPRPDIQLVINSSPYMYEFLKENPIPFKVSAKCCDYCKKHPAHKVQKDYEMIITGERRDEGGMRSVPKALGENETMCFSKTGNGQFKFKPLFYVSDEDKAWYKTHYNIRYSDAYEVYGFTRTGCCGCSISSKAVEDLEKLKTFEPKVYKAAWAIFGESYIFRQKYNEFKQKQNQVEGQMTLGELK